MRYEKKSFGKHTYFSLFIFSGRSIIMYESQCVTPIVTVVRDVIHANVTSRDMAPLNAPVNFSSLLGISFHLEPGRKRGTSGNVKGYLVSCQCLSIP
jgi:hypothetical protein